MISIVDNMSNDLLMSLENDMKMLLVLSASEENEQAYEVNLPYFFILEMYFLFEVIEIFLDLIS